MSNDGQDWWNSAVQRNRDALLRIVAVLFVYAGLDEGGADEVPRRVGRMILRLLRPAESAARRLIVIAARGITVEAPRSRPVKPPTGIEQLQAAGLLVIHKGINFGLARAPRSEPATEPQIAEPRIPAFPLADPPRRFDTRSWDGLHPFPQEGFAFADPDEAVDATRLCRRLRALKRALDDLPGQARRFARWKARRDLASRSLQGAKQRFRRSSLLRSGWPPGYRKSNRHEVDGVLRECHSLARHALDSPPLPIINHSN
jgi:hypothetical protein